MLKQAIANVEWMRKAVAYAETYQQEAVAGKEAMDIARNMPEEYLTLARGWKVNEVFRTYMQATRQTGERRGVGENPTFEEAFMEVLRAVDPLPVECSELEVSLHELQLKTAWESAMRESLEAKLRLSRQHHEELEPVVWRITMRLVEMDTEARWREATHEGMLVYQAETLIPPLVMPRDKLGRWNVLGRAQMRKHREEVARGLASWYLRDQYLKQVEE